MKYHIQHIYIDVIQPLIFTLLFFDCNKSDINVVDLLPHFEWITFGGQLYNQLRLLKSISCVRIVDLLALA